MKNRRNYYRILQVQPDAPPEVIKASYRTLMGRLKNHPDLGGTATAAVLINDAYQTLSDLKKRADYDQGLFEKQSKRSVSGTTKQESIKKEACPVCEEDGKGSPDLFHEGRCPVCGKRVQEKSHHSTQTSEQRESDRHQKEGNLSYQYFQSEKKHSGKLIDLSSKGVRFISKEKMARSTELKIESPLLKGTVRITNCREAWSQNRPVYFVGARFATVEFYRSRGTFLSIKV
ncbi:MAG: J domain-containing protein [Nitrospira sp.]